MELKKEIEPEVLQIAESGYSFNIGDYIKKGWEVFNKDMGQFILFIVILGAIQFVVNLITGAISGGGNFMAANARGMDFESFFTASQIISSGTGWIIGLALAPLQLGTMIVAKKIYHNEDYEFKDFFSGYGWFLPIVLGSLLVGLFVGFGIVLLIIPGIYLAVAYQYVNQFILFRNYDFWQAMEASRKVITKNWFAMFLFLIVLGLINFGGLLLCGLGLLFTIPLSICAMYAAFAHVMEQAGLGDNNEETQDENLDSWGFDTPPPPSGESTPGDQEDPFI